MQHIHIHIHIHIHVYVYVQYSRYATCVLTLACAKRTIQCRVD